MFYGRLLLVFNVCISMEEIPHIQEAIGYVFTLENANLNAFICYVQLHCYCLFWMDLSDS